jgi:hypothetical protein
MIPELELIADKFKLLKEIYPKHSGQQYQICPLKIKS